MPRGVRNTEHTGGRGRKGAGRTQNKPRRSTEQVVGAGAFSIEDGIPMPERTGSSGKYLPTLRQLTEGQSFLIPITDPTVDPDNVRKSVCRSASSVGIPIATKAVEGGVRVWRKADKE